MLYAFNLKLTKSGKTKMSGEIGKRFTPQVLSFLKIKMDQMENNAKEYAKINKKS